MTHPKNPNLFPDYTSLFSIVRVINMSLFGLSVENELHN